MPLIPIMCRNDINTEKVLLSIIVPLYNGELFLTQLLDSIRCQLSDSIEVILVNDGSTDSTEEICKNYLGINNFRYFKKPNSGVCTTRNFGIERASGKYITFADQDDWYDPGAFSMLTNIIENNDFDLVIFEPRIHYSNGNTFVFEMPCETREWHNEAMYDNVIRPTILGIKDEYGRGFNFGLWNCLFRRSFLEINKLRLDSYLRMGEDIVFISQCLGAATSVYTVAQPLYNYRVHSSSVSHTYSKTSDLSIVKSIYIYDKQVDALAKWDKKDWMPIMNARYSSILISFARSWTHPKAGNTPFTVYKKLREVFQNTTLSEKISALNPCVLHGRKRIEMLIIKSRSPFLLMVYGYTVNIALRFRTVMK